MDEPTELALKEIALLVGVGQEMYDMAITFRNYQELDIRAATPHAEAVTRFVTRAAKRLVEGMVRRGDKRAHALLEARHASVKELIRAIASAQVLSDMEVEAMRKINISGNFIKLRILAPLQGLDWPSITPPSQEEW